MSRDEFIAIWNSSDSVDEVKRRTGINHPSERAAVLRRDGYTLKFFGGSQGYEDDRQEFIAIWNSSDSPEEVQERTGLSGVSPKAAKLREMGYELKLMRTMPDTQGYYWAGVFDAKATISFIPNLRLRMTPPAELLEDIQNEFPGASQETYRDSIRLTWSGENAKNVLRKIKRHSNVFAKDAKRLGL
jgi:hypothetical protein